MLGLCLLGIGLAAGLPHSVSADGVAFRSARVRLVNNTMYLTTLDSNGIDVNTYPLEPSAAARVQPGWRISGSLKVASSGLALLEDITIISEQRSATVAVGAALKLVVYRVTIATATNCNGKPCEPACSVDQLRQWIDTDPDSVRNFYLMASLGKFNMADISIENVALPAPVSYVGVLGAISRIKTVPKANFYVIILPPYLPTATGGSWAGMGDMPGSTSWYAECSFRVIVHELLHNLNLDHAGAYLAQNGQFVEYGDESSVMSAGSLLTMVKEGQRRPNGWLGLAAPQLSMLGWLPADAVLSIDRNGDYSINSLSSNNGVRAAVVKSASQTYWVEWRDAINQDLDLASAQHYFGSLRNRGSVLNSLLVKTVSGRKTLLQAMVDPGKRVTLGSVTFEHFPTAGTFRVSGFPPQEGETQPPIIPTLPLTTTTTTEDPGTYPPDVVLPSGPECRASGAVGVCTTSSKCPGGASFKLSGCRSKGFGCCF